MTKPGTTGDLWDSLMGMKGGKATDLVGEFIKEVQIGEGRDFFEYIDEWVFGKGLSSKQIRAFKAFLLGVTFGTMRAEVYARSRAARVVAEETRRVIGDNMGSKN